MSQSIKILLFIVLPTLAALMLPPDYFAGNAFVGVILLIALMVALGFLLLRGYTMALSLLIFILGFNVIVRLMMLLPRVYNNQTGGINVLFLVTSLASIALSTYLLLRLDRSDVRVQMYR